MVNRLYILKLKIIFISLCALSILLFSNCTTTDTTKVTGNVSDEQSITKNGITFIAYTADVVKQWGFDGASNAISVPGSDQYSCGLVVRRDEQAENFVQVKISAASPAYISSILPSILPKGLDTVTISPFTTTGKVAIEVNGANSDLAGKDDYWGGALNSIDAYLYSPIIFPNVNDSSIEYYLCDLVPTYQPTNADLLNDLNKILQQAVVNIKLITMAGNVSPDNWNKIYPGEYYAL